MSQGPRPVIAYACPRCGTTTVTQRETEPRQLLDWEDTIWVELVFKCANCEWSQVVARYPAGRSPRTSGAVRS